MPEQIEQSLRERLSATEVEVEDESWRHRGHAGASEGGHYVVRVVSPAFEGKSRVERHRMVYAALDQEMSGLHALQIQPLTPAEAARSNAA